MRPVNAYVDHLRLEILKARRALPGGLTMGRPHLGGVTPTILPPAVLTRLLGNVFAAFTRTTGFAFPGKIDPIAAAPDLLRLLIACGLISASIGIKAALLWRCPSPKDVEAAGADQGCGPA